MSNPAVCCVDVGSIPKGRFAWYCRGADGRTCSGQSMEGVADVVASELLKSLPVALGFECPLWLPLPQDPRVVASARSFEGCHSWSAGAGCAVLATGIAQTTWILHAIRHRVGDNHQAFLDESKFSENGFGLLLWEAFVCGPAKGTDHLADAQSAVRAFDTKRVLDVREEAVTSLIGAALLRTGWSTDISFLSRACLVIKA